MCAAFMAAIPFWTAERESPKLAVGSPLQVRRGSPPPMRKGEYPNAARESPKRGTNSYLTVVI